VLQVAQLLGTEPARERVKSWMRQQLTQRQSLEEEESMLEGTINLVTRLYAMVNAGPLQNEISSQWSMLWSDGPLDKAIHAHFNEQISSDTDDTVLTTDFTARNIDRDANIKIIWTNNLVDHLPLVDKDKKLCIFHHAPFLRRMEFT
jgi:hypothetical protein